MSFAEVIVEPFPEFLWLMPPKVCSTLAVIAKRGFSRLDYLFYSICDHDDYSGLYYSVLSLESWIRKLIFIIVEVQCLNCLKSNKLKKLSPISFLRGGAGFF